MIKRYLGMASLAAVMLAVAQPASAQFGGLMSAVKNKGVSGSAPDVNGFLVRARDAELLTRRSADGILAAVASQAKVAEIDAARKANAAIADPKEREAAERKVDSDVDASTSRP